MEQMQQLLGDEFGELLDAFFISLDELISLLPQALAERERYRYPHTDHRHDRKQHGIRPQAVPGSRHG
ncbi:hypothetical protein QQ73_09885 [Candidatus Endoriftia persephone str. Guaymas]|nr:hypothetical protein [Candidatus Endoriftia persephone str. Guaymas]